MVADHGHLFFHSWLLTINWTTSKGYKVGRKKGTFHLIEKGFLRDNHITIILYFVTQDFFVIEIELSVKFHKFSYVFMIPINVQ